MSRIMQQNVYDEEKDTWSLTDQDHYYPVTMGHSHLVMVPCTPIMCQLYYFDEEAEARQFIKDLGGDDFAVYFYVQPKGATL